MNYIMNRNKNLFKCSRCLLMVCAILVAIGSVPQQAFAKLSVTRTVTAVVKKSLNKSTSYKVTYNLDCSGNPLWITAKQGKTYVYVNEHGIDFCDCSECEVEIPEEFQITWNNVIINCGIREDESEPTLVKMDGGSVGTIDMNYYKEGLRHFDARITGGRLSTLVLPRYGDGLVSISKLQYTGNRILTNQNAECVLFINNDCEFYAGSTMFSDDDMEELSGAFIPDSENPNIMLAYGHALVPAGERVVCDRIVDKGMIDFSVGEGASVQVKKCDGWQSKKGVPTGVTVVSHNTISYIQQHAKCLEPEITVTYCDLCGKRDERESKSKLGHNIVDDSEIPATCYHSGLTAGKHCSRCGFIPKDGARKKLEKLEHTYGNEVTISNHACFPNKSFGKPLNGNGSVTYHVCRYCYKMEILKGDVSNAQHVYVNSDEMKLMSGSFTEIINGKQVTTKYKDFAAKVQRIECEADCTHDGVKFDICKNCRFIQPTITPAYNHSFNKVDRVEPTCETAGHEAYYKCKNKGCGIKSRSMSLVQSQTFEDINDVYIHPTGHSYGVPEAYVRNVQTKVSSETCSSPAIYHQTCANEGCGRVNDNLIFYGEDAKGHQYFIESIDYNDSIYPDEGYLTVACEACGGNWPGLLYTISDEVGTVKSDGTFNGYWTKTQLIQTKEMPTCQPGWGTYRLTLNFHGTKMSKDFDNYITPMGYVHNYDDDGICREHHYEWQRNEDGTITKYYAGEIQNKNFGNAQSGEFVFHDDETVYSTHGYIAVPYQAECMYDDGSTYVEDPEDGSRMYYTDYHVVNYTSPEEFASDLLHASEDCYAAYYDDVALDISSTPYDVLTRFKSCNVSTIKSSNSKIKDLNLHGNKIYSYLNDGTVYNANQSRITSNKDVRYYRKFNNSSWQAVFLPIDIYASYLPSNVHLAEISDFSEHDGKLSSMTVTYKTNGWTNTNTPYLIKVDEPGEMMIQVSSACIDPANAGQINKSTPNYNIAIVGTHTGVSGQTMVDNQYFALSGGQLMRTNSNQVSLKPQRWYMSITDKAGNPVQSASMRVVVYEDDAETSALQVMKVEAQSETYTLDGRKVNDEVDLMPGIYVQNGKRVIVK